MHYSDNDDEKDRDDPEYTATWKFQDLMDLLNEKLKEQFGWIKSWALDESMVKSKTRMLGALRRRIGNKPIKDGFKNWVIAQKGCPMHVVCDGGLWKEKVAIAQEYNIEPDTLPALLMAMLSVIPEDVRRGGALYAVQYFGTMQGAHSACCGNPGVCT